MSPPVKIAGFLAVLAALFGLSLAVGNAVGPVSDADQADQIDQTDRADRAPARQAPARQAEPDAVAPEEIPTGLTIAQNGYALVLADFLAAGVTEPGPEIVFSAAVPSDGDYRLLLDFQHDGVVRTAAFALGAGETTGATGTTGTTGTTGSQEKDDAHDH